MYNRELPTGTSIHDMIIYLDFGNNTAIDKKSRTAYTENNMTYGVTIHNSVSAIFNGTTSSVDIGSDVLSIGAGTICCWINIDTYGENSDGRILDNGKTIIAASDTSDNILISSDGGVTTVGSAADSLEVATDYHVGITRDAAGVSNIYINGELSGDADQDSGTPEAGDTNIIIGNNAAGARALDGKISGFQLYNMILTNDQIRQIYNKFK